MDKEKKRVSNVHLSAIRRTWLLVIPAIIAIIGLAAFTSILLTSSRSNSMIEIQDKISSLDRGLLNDIRGNFRSTYLQLLQAQINPESDPDRIEQLAKRLDELALQEGEIIHEYDPSYVSTSPSAMEVSFGILAEMPYPIIFTISLAWGILLFIIVRYIALLIISKRYSSDSDYVREV
jgi:hypothetical protein